MKQKMIDLCADRAKFLDEAEAALKAGDQAKVTELRGKLESVDKDIENVKFLMAEQQRRMDEAPVDRKAEKEKAEALGQKLLRDGQMSVDIASLRRGLLAKDSTTLAATTLVEPTGSGTEIRNPVGGGVSRIIDQVRVLTLEGMGGFIEPYLVSAQAAQAGAVATLAGTARTASDPTFAYAELKPYEVNVTTYVDRNIKRLSPADYFAKCYELAMEAMRRKICALIYNGDGQTSPAMYGIKTAKNKAGDAIYNTVEATALDETVLDALYYAYGDDEGTGENAQLYLTKADLKVLGSIRNSDKLKVFQTRHTGANYGTIEDGGAAYGYNIGKDLTDFASATTGGLTMCYGDPQNYELALFGEMTVRIDESAKAVERMLTILGDAMVGGNLIVDKGFVIANLPKSGG